MIRMYSITLEKKKREISEQYLCFISNDDNQEYFLKNDVS